MIGKNEVAVTYDEKVRGKTCMERNIALDRILKINNELKAVKISSRSTNF